MDVGAGWRVAVGAHRVVEYLLSPPTHTLPRMPAHCPGILIWQERMIPVLDLAPVLSEQAQAQEHEVHRAVVLAYQEMPGQPLRYGALVVRAAPVEVWVSDDMACPLPEDPPAFKHFSCSCFAHQEESIPILDTTRLFATALSLAPAERKDEAEANPIREVSPSPTRPADFAKTQPLEVAALAPIPLAPQREPFAERAQSASEARQVSATPAEASVDRRPGVQPSSAVSGENVFTAETQDRHEDADLPRDIDGKPPASTRCWLVGAALAVTLLATALHPFSPSSLRDVSEPVAWGPTATSPERNTAPQQVVSIESEALALTVERPAGGDARPARAKPAAPASVAPPVNPNTRTHVVVRGDTLWDIAKTYVGDPFRYPELTELSNIRNPDLIHPGDIVRIEIRENRN
jgi:nucleoid-associated protein YgaU/chemotaxis signal transduction protein